MTTQATTLISATSLTQSALPRNSEIHLQKTNAPPDANNSAEKPKSRADVEVAAKKTQDFVQSLNSSLQFSVDDTTGATVVKVIDMQTKETIRQIPSEEMLDIARALDRLNGLLVKDKA